MAYELFINQRLNQNFTGHAELCGYSFSLWPEQLPLTRWTAQQLINAHSQELAKENSILLEIRAWEDVAPTWTTDYYVEVVATASPLFWNIIIIGALVVLAIGGVGYIINKTEDIIEYAGPGAIPWITLGFIAAAAVVGIALVRR